MKYTRHIVFVTPGFATDAADTVCTPYLQTYFRALHAARPDWRISIVAMQYPYRRSAYDWNGLEVRSMGGKNRAWAKPITWQRTRKAIRALHRIQPIDVLHSFWLTEATKVAAQSAKKLGIPHFATAMGQDVLPANRYLQTLRLQRMTIIGLSAANAAYFEATTGRPLDAMIHWGIAPEDVDATANADRPIDLLAVGSLIPVKRYDRFVRMVSMLRDTFPHLRAELIGEGKDAKALAQQINELGVQDHLSLTGPLPHGEVLARMSRAKVFVHTSQMEGMCLVIAEALARGMHVVTTPVGIGAALMHGPAARKCQVSEHTFGLAEAAAAFLKEPVDWAPQDIFPISEIVTAYLNLYRLDD